MEPFPDRAASARKLFGAEGVLLHRAQPPVRCCLPRRRRSTIHYSGPRRYPQGISPTLRMRDIGRCQGAARSRSTSTVPAGPRASSIVTFTPRSRNTRKILRAARSSHSRPSCQPTTLTFETLPRATLTAKCGVLRKAASKSHSTARFRASRHSSVRRTSALHRTTRHRSAGRQRGSVEPTLRQNRERSRQHRHVERGEADVFAVAVAQLGLPPRRHIDMDVRPRDDAHLGQLRVARVDEPR